MTRSLLVGVLVGGRGRRMGGAAKGLLLAPDTGEPLAARLVRTCRETLHPMDIVLVGDATSYSVLALPALADQPSGVGPLGGLVGLLREGARRHCSTLALAADLPYVTAPLVEYLASYARDAAAVAPRLSGRWHPLFARYVPEHCLPPAERLLAEGRHAAHGILDVLGASASVLPLDDAQGRLLDDWDVLADVRK